MEVSVLEAVASLGEQPANAKERQAHQDVEDVE